MSKTKRTLLLASVSVLNLLVTAIGSLVVSRVILIRLGSDYNGLNAVISQFLMVVTLTEGGFTTASLVAMFKPYGEGDYAEVARLYAESDVRFRKIGRWTVLFGVPVAVLFAFAINSEINYLTILAVLLLSLSTSAFNLYYVTKVRILFQITQSEHVIVLVTVAANLLSQISMAFIIFMSGNFVLARCAPLIAAVFSGVISHKLFFRKNKSIIVATSWDQVKRIHGTKDVLIGKIVSVIHSSASVIFLSVFASTLLTSVYAVYNSVISVVSHVINIAISAPQNALGLVLQQEDRAYAKDVVEEIEYLIILIIATFFSALGTVLLPFVEIYTSGISDVEYMNPVLAAVLLLTVYLQLIHIPSGLCINLSGRFDIARRFQMVALVVLVSGCLLLGMTFGFYGVLGSIAICNVVLAVLEIGYTHREIFPGSLGLFMKTLVPHFLVTVGLILTLYFAADQYIYNYVSFFICGCCVFLLDALFIFLFNVLFFRKRLSKSLYRIKGLFKKG